MAVKKKVPVKKKAPPAKKSAKKVVKPVEIESPQIPPLAQFRLVTGEELVGYVDDGISPEGIIVYNPMTITMYGGQLFLIPYALNATSRIFYFNHDHIVSLYEIDESFSHLYTASAQNLNDSKALYDQVIHNSTKYALTKRETRDSLSEPTAADLAKVQEEQKAEGRIGVSADGAKSEEGNRTKSKLIDDLVKLANDKGLGIDKDAKKEE